MGVRFAASRVRPSVRPASAPTAALPATAAYAPPMSDSERADAFRRHLSSKYGVSEGDVSSAWQMLEKN